MYCNKCGAKLSEQERFCNKCGNAVDGTKVRDVSQPNKKGRKIFVLIIIAILLLTAGTVAVIQTGVLNPLEHNLNLGYKYLNEGKYEQAIIAFNKVLEIDEKNTNAVIGISDAYIGLDKFEEAVDFIKQHLAKYGTNEALYEKLITLYINNQDYDGAKKAIQQAAENGYEYKTDSLDETTREKLTDLKQTGFQKGRYVTETNGKVVTVDEDGIKVRSSDSDEENLILAGGFDEYFVTDGETVYFYNHNDLTIRALKISTGSVTDLATVYNNVTLEEGYEDFYGDGQLIGYCNGYLYFQEWYGPGDFKDFMLELDSNTYREMATAYGIGELWTYDDKIYYDEWRTERLPVTIYEADADGSKEKALLQNVMNISIIGNKLYYSQITSDYPEMYQNTAVKSYDLDTKQTKTIENITCSNGWVSFADFGYGYGKTSDNDSYDTHIEVYGRSAFEGSTIKMKSYIWDSGFNYFICRKINEGNPTSLFDFYSVVYKGKLSNDISIPTSGEVIGYFGNKLYYYNNTEYGSGLKSDSLTFRE